MAKAANSSPAVRFTGEERLVVLHGPEYFLKIHYLHELRTAVEKAKGGEADTLHFDGQKAALADVLDELRSFGLMQQHKIVVVDDAEDFVTAHREALERYAASPVDIATLVLRSGKWVSTAKLHKAVEKVGAVVKCDKLNAEAAAAWARRHCQTKYGLTIAPEAATMLVEHVDTDLGRIDTELGKLAVGVPEGQAIGAAQVESLVGRASDQEAWAIQEALLSGDPRQAIGKLRELIDLSGASEVLVTYAVADLMRKLHHAAVLLGRRMNDFAVCSSLKVWPQERQRPFLAAARRLGVARAARLAGQIIELDARSKSGVGEPAQALERFCVQFTGQMH
jgi:DNA polymerase-3 subunit delta